MRRNNYIHGHPHIHIRLFIGVDLITQSLHYSSRTAILCIVMYFVKKNNVIWNEFELLCMYYVESYISISYYHQYLLLSRKLNVFNF